MGSVFGTYIKIRFNERHLLKTGNDIIIGTHIHLHIQRVSINCIQDANTQYKTFYYKYLFKEIMKNGTVMVGLCEEDQTVLEQMFENYQHFLNDNEFQMIEIDKKHELHLPYIKFTFFNDSVIPDYSLPIIQSRT